MTDQAHARRNDPGTSHEAAAYVTPDLRELQARVAAYALRKGLNGFTDAEMECDLNDPGSTYRTRRSELAARHIIIDSGHRRRWGGSPRTRIIWVHRDFALNPPPIGEAVAPTSSADKAEARNLGNSLVSIAAGLQRQGMSAAAEQIEKGGRMLQRFGQ